MVATHLEPLPKYWTIGKEERENVLASLKTPLSGYLGGSRTGGYWVERLNAEWSETFRCLSIACNSATSGLHAACAAAGIGPGDEVWVTAYSMSATAACAIQLGAKVRFIDIDEMSYCISFNELEMSALERMKCPRAVIVTNLFGHPADLFRIRKWCDANSIIMIEDNAQAPYAKIDNRYTGTIGHLGVFSLNVHKHLQCGEGGVVVTQDAELAAKVQLFINHGELATSKIVGLNLRMTEPIAAIACAQLKKGPVLVATRIIIGQEISECFRESDFVRLPFTGRDCVQVYYLWAGQVMGTQGQNQRFIAALQNRGVPVKLGYTRPLHRVFGTEDKCPVADMVENSMITFEVCAYNPKPRHLRTMRDIILQETERLGGSDEGIQLESDTAA